ncbi:MAG: AbrB/MazE/SpoVT family DNA-binding domain-containing protein [Candidatus Gracilibacteria bacterium]|nr:AbrB/MazE/SpoVT family DNA-binding domain-containing protein [Candidatus Gracilibacteria bacterium]
MKKNKCVIKLYGTTTIGPKGQVVIPKEVRNILNLNTGDSISVLIKDDKFIGMVKNEDISELMEYIESEKK